MDQKEYEQTIDEMQIPASKILTWANIIKKEYYSQYNETNQNLFDQVFEEAHNLVNLIPNLRLLKNKHDRAQAITHGAAGPIIAIRDYTILILAHADWKPEAEQSEEEREHIRYLKKIKSAAEYLASLDRDAVLKMMLDRIDKGE